MGGLQCQAGAQAHYPRVPLNLICLILTTTWWGSYYYPQEEGESWRNEDRWLAEVSLLVNDGVCTMNLESQAPVLNHQAML
jgi:hypothetical protein